MTQNLHKLLTHLHYVSGTCPGRELSEIPANYTNSAQFAHILRELRKICTIINPFILCFRGLPRQRALQNSSELCKFCAIHPQLPRITRNSHHLLTHYIVCFRCLTSGRELPKIPANQTKFAQFAHTSCKLRELCAFHTKFYPHLVH